MPESKNSSNSSETAPSDLEKYRLKDKSDIVLTLNEVSKKPDLINVYFKGDSIITTVLKVLAERDLLLLESGPDEKKNRQLLKTGTATCVTKHNDIDIRFKVTDLRPARYQGQHVIAAPIPESVMRLQRREYFRVHTPLIKPLLCRLTDSHGKMVELPLADISIGGLCMLDSQHALAAELLTQLDDCILIFPDKGGELTVTLEVRSLFMQRKGNEEQAQRIGCAFIDLANSDSIFIQRYINRLQMQQKNLSRA